MVGVWCWYEVKMVLVDVDVFHYETPLCKEFMKFNYLLQIDSDVLTGDLPGFKTDEEFRNTWYYEWNDQIPWVWDETCIYKHVHHTCEPYLFKDGSSEWPTCNWKYDKTCNGGNIIGMKRVGNDIHFEDHEWYEKVEDCPRKAEALQEKGRIEYLKRLKGTSDTTFWEWVHKRCDDYTKLDRSLQWKLKRKWDEIQDYYQSINLVNYYPNYNFEEAPVKLKG